MKFKVNTFSNTKGFMFKLTFVARKTFDNKWNGVIGIFFFRHGIDINFGPEYLIG